MRITQVTRVTRRIEVMLSSIYIVVPVNCVYTCCCHIFVILLTRRLVRLHKWCLSDDHKFEHCREGWK